MAIFQYDPALLARYPNVVGGVIIARGLSNGATPPELLQEYQKVQAEVVKQLNDKPLSQLPSLAAWRAAFSAFGVEPTKYRSAAEALLRRLTKKGDIPSINLLVDLGNLVSIHYALPVAVFDTREVQGAITVRFADGSEVYTPLGEAIIEHPETGEVIFADDAGVVLARRWCWRQSEQSAAQPYTTEAVITVEAHHANGRNDIEAALNDLQTLLRRYSSATLQTAILDANNPRIEG